uniref:Uncharacterized protein n=1 Tax=Panagrolaimus sp. ES5 TaxID=591445 RepID=A0AC34FAZ0_9BILA
MASNNDDERIIFTEDPSQDLAVISPRLHPTIVTPNLQNNSLIPKLPSSSAAAAATVSTLQNGINIDDFNNLKTEYTKLKMDHSKLKSDHEKLKNDYDNFKEETEHRLQQLFLAVTRQGGEDLIIIFGRDNIHHYTAASSRVKKGLTPISPEVIEAIRTLMYEGFRIDKNSSDSNRPDAGHKRNEIDRVIKSTSSYLFNNSRRSKNQSSPRNSVHGYYEDSSSQIFDAQHQQQHGNSISDSDSEGTYPKRMRIIENLDDCFKYEPDAEF